MDDRQFDQRLKELLHRHHEPVPEAVWDKVAPGIQRKKRGAAWWKYAGILFVLLAGFGYLGRLNQNPESVHNSHASRQTKGLSQPAPGLTAQPSSGSPIADKPVPEQTPLLSQANQKPASAIETTTPTASTKVDGITAVVSLQGVPDPALGHTQESESQEAGDLTHAFPETSPPQLPTSAATDPDALPATAGLEASADEETAVNSVPQSKLPEASPSPRNSGFSIEILTAAEFPSKNLENQNGPTSENYRTLRQESELHDYAYNISLFLRAELSPAFFIRTGLHYERIYEKLSVKVTDLFISKILVDTLLKGFVLDPFQPPQPYFLIDTIYDYEYNSFQHKKSNRYIFVSIPVTAGYQVSLKKFDLYATAGFILNIATYTKGAIIAPDSEYMLVLEDPDSSPFTSRSGISAHASMGLAYQLTPSTSFLIEPAFRKGLGSMTKETYPLSQRYDAFSVGIGIRFDF